MQMLVTFYGSFGPQTLLFFSSSKIAFWTVSRSCEQEGTYKSKEKDLFKGINSCYLLES
jgi:hypothetical protein